MRNPDLVCVWPKHIDYPPFRLFIRLYRGFFGKVIIVFTDMNNALDFTQEIMSHMNYDGIIFEFSYFIMGQDWRSVAVNRGIDRSDSSWVLFMEQDFFIKSSQELTDIWEERRFSNVIGFEEGDRLHPAFLLVSRKAIDSSSRDFSAKPPEYDHFGKFIQEIGEARFLDDLDIIKYEGYNHMNGLTHNIYLASINQVENIYKRDEFIKYLKGSSINIEVSAKYKNMVNMCLRNLGEQLL